MYKKIFKRFLFSMLGVALFCVLGVNPALAEDGYSAKEVSRSFKSLYIKPGAAITFEIKYENTGTKTWVNDGPNFLEIATNDPVKRKSEFQHQFWEKFFLPGRLKEKAVLPGAIGTFRFAIQAPITEGTYNEKFIGVAKQLAWVDGLEFSIPIEVSAKPKPKKVVTNENQVTDILLTNATPVEAEEAQEKVEELPIGEFDWAAQLLIQSRKRIEIEAGKTISLALGFKNIGKKTWEKNSRNFVSFYTVKPKYHKSLFFEKTSWLSSNQVRLDTEKVGVGELGYFNFNITAPIIPGTYVDKFNLAAEDKAWFKHGEFELEVHVLPAKNDIVLTGVENNITPNGEYLTNLTPDGVKQNLVLTEPLMRVGLARYSDEEPESIQLGSASDYKIIDIDKRELHYVTSGTVATAFFNPQTSLYELTLNGVTYEYEKALRFEPVIENGIIEFLSFDDRPKWNERLNYNLFKGIIEYSHNTVKNRTWVINELPMEEYLNGLIETSNPNPIEYLKTMTIAARSYALYEYLHNVKYGREGFHVDAFYDQVYKGYVAESYLSRLGDAGESTKGIVVTYEGENVVTPYFAHSNGRTLDWTDVWGGSKRPWLIGVSDPYNAGRSMYGHGVGLSARGALLMARNEGATFQEILKYYYTGIELEQQYQ